MRGLPPGSNVGKQLRARRARIVREQRRAAEQAETAALKPPRQLALPSAEGWFAAQGYAPFEFQREVWRHIAAGLSGLLHASTGAGKTYAAWFGLLNLALAGQVRGGGLRLVWVTPMRALAADTARALAAPLADLGLDWKVGVRTGDTDSAERTRQSQRLPEALVTTPESLSLLLARADARETLGGVAMVVVDEWHELIGSKRGVQTQLALARVRGFAGTGGSRPHRGPPHEPRQVGASTPPPQPSPAGGGGSSPLPCEAGEGRGGGAGNATKLIVWALSATLGNLDEALHALHPHGDGVLVRGEIDKQIVIDTLLPAEVGRFPWGGHLGIQMLAPVVEQIEATRGSTLVFTNTRSQAEIWYQSLLAARPKWAGEIALHHGSLDKSVRDWVEAGLRDGRLRAVVATSSLDLGVDFLPVERVLQIGSPKGVARLLQRAGRSGHAPGRASRVTLVPTHALELVEAVAAREAAAARRVESRAVPAKPLDVLVQHLVTVALGGGFTEDELLAEVCGTASYATLTDEEWHWALDFVGRGGALAAYPEYQRVRRGDDGVYRVADAAIGRRHRMSIGTIVADAAMLVRYANGGTLGTIEESFIARLRPGDVFTFAGKRLELVGVREMTAFVAPATSRSGAVPRWAGTKLPLSTELADALLAQLEAARAGRYASAELRQVRPLLELQARWSSLPTATTLVAETLRSREGRHLFVYPFAGRSAHLGIASLLALRAGRVQPATFSIAVNDYGFELLTPTEVDWHALWSPRAGLLAEEGLLDDVLASLNAGELAQRRIREIARVAGLIFQGYPGAPKSVKQLQASSGLFYEVLRKYDAGNPLLTQAKREVLEQELELARLRAALARMRAQRRVLHATSRPTPFAFPLLVERLREQLTTEKLADRVARMVAELEELAG